METESAQVDRQLAEVYEYGCVFLVLMGLKLSIVLAGYSVCENVHMRIYGRQRRQIRNLVVDLDTVRLLIDHAASIGAIDAWIPSTGMSAGGFRRP